MDLNLREHQLKVVDSLRDGFRKGYRSQLLYAPTGFGKTEVSIYLMKATADKGHRAAMVLDRLVLVDQTSMRLTKYQLEHGVMQANHWNYNSSSLIQVCSAQTLERRNDFPKVDLLIVDECHIMRAQIAEYIKANPSMRVVGLTATPFTKGLGNIYENVVCGSTTESLVSTKWLTPLRVFVAREIDMTGAKKIAGEWSQNEATERGMKITGDIVAEWIKKTHEIFGGPKKTIVFCAGVAHGKQLVEEFKSKGYNFVSISYKDDDQDKRDAIEDFSRPDTEIHGLIATDILTRGFDVPDVLIGVSARPFSKSLSSHIQQLGRVMRPYPEKDFAVWLDHSGNYLRFRDDWDEVFAVGVNKLDNIVEKAKKEPTEKEKKSAKCPECGFLWDKKDLVCPSCGYKRKTHHLDTAVGVMEELKGGANKGQKDDRQDFYSQLIWVARERGYKIGWASHKYKEKFGVWPRNMMENASPPTTKVLGWIRSRNIAFSKSKPRVTL